MDVFTALSGRQTIGTRENAYDADAYKLPLAPDVKSRKPVL